MNLMKEIDNIENIIKKYHINDIEEFLLKINDFDEILNPSYIEYIFEYENIYQYFENFIKNNIQKMKIKNEFLNRNIKNEIFQIYFEYLEELKDEKMRDEKIDNLMKLINDEKLISHDEFNHYLNFYSLK
jgi:hypothetical protein